MVENETTVVDWERQAIQFKAELDALNPRLNVAEARIRELETTAALLTKQKDDAIVTGLTVSNEYAAFVKTADERISRQSEAIESTKIEFCNQVEAVASLSRSLNEATAEVNRLKVAIDQKNASLSACIKGVADQLATLQAAVAAGA